MLNATLAQSEDDLGQVLQLQRQNLKQHLSDQEMREQGFVTLQHDLATLQQMHRLAPSVVIRDTDNDKLVAYALTLLKECRSLLTDLEPMFALLEQLSWNGTPLRHLPFYVMGQVCVDKDYRSRGLFDQLYAKHRDVYRSRFELFVTEIATRNHRSFRAHERIGFRPLHVYRDDLDEWTVVAWDWR